MKKKSSCLDLKAKNLDSWYVASTVALTKFAQIVPLGLKSTLPWGHIFYIGLYKENLKKSCRQLQCLEPWY